MRICTTVDTGKLIEMQSDATMGTLLKNALASGYTEKEVEEREVTEKEWVVILAAQPKPPPGVDRLLAVEEKLSQLTTTLVTKNVITAIEAPKLTEKIK
jgi:hypothetical protein